MKSKQGVSQKIRAVLALVGVLVLGLSTAEAATPFGLVFASGTLTSQGGGEGGADGQVYTSPAGQQRIINIGYFNPTPATNAFPTGWLPGSFQVYNPDGSILFDVENIPPAFIWFPGFWGGTPWVFLSVPVTFQGQQAYLTATIMDSNVTGGAPHVSISVWTSTNASQGYNHVAFYHEGSLTGAAIVDP